MVNQLPDEKLQEVVDYLKQLFFQKTEVHAEKLSREQEELLDLLNYTIDSGRGDFTERYDPYL